MDGLLYYQMLSSLGRSWPLQFYFNSAQMKRLLTQNSSLWDLYGEDLDNPRQGLCLTSLDGTYNRTPNLRSLGSFNKQQGSSYNELDYTYKMPILKSCTQLESFLNTFPEVGRICAIRLQKSGHFPPHRDGAGRLAKGSDLNSFRLILPLDSFDQNNTVLKVDHQAIALEAGTLYFLDTLKCHSVVNNRHEAYFIVFSLPLTSACSRRAIEYRAER